MDKYIKQAQDFLNKTGTEMKIKFLKRDFHFKGDKEKRNIFKISLKRGNREYIFNFGDSIKNTIEGKIPNIYDILACLKVSYIEDFNDFCNIFGYSNDSISAKEIYEKVIEEQKQLQILYSDKEIEILNNII